MAQPAKPASTGTKLIFKDSITVIHHLFKLSTAGMMKNISNDKEAPEYRPMDHQHFFHTVDSDGKKQDRCAPVGGHFHEVKVVPGASPDHAPTIQVGPAVMEVKRIIRGKPKKFIEPIPWDNHTHNGIYERSEKLERRTLSAQAAQLISSEAVKESLPPGIVG